VALFSRKDRKADIDKYITEAVEKAAQSLMGTPMYNNAGYANVVPAQPTGGQGLAQQSGWEAVALPRPGDAFGSMLGPAAPLLPSPIDPVSAISGRAEPRKFQYQVAYNLNLTQQEVPWSVLRSLAEQCDIISRAITIRTADISKMEWSFTLSSDAIQRIMTEENVSHAKAAKIGRERFGDKIDELTAFWRNPYPQSDKGWNQWITESAWNVLTFDGWAIYPKYNLGGKVIGFDIIDPSTIKILLDDRGDTPRPPAPAYQQILWGFPRGEFTASPDSDVDGQYYTGANSSAAYKTDQLSYFMQNRRTYSVYGFSAVEQAIPAATLYLERQRWMIEDFQAGTMPMTFMKTDSTELNHLKLAEFERVFNDKLVGSSEERHKVKVLPKGFDPIVAPSMSERYKPEYDEFIIKRIASIFGVAPSQLGVVARAGLGGGKGAHDGEEQSAETVSSRPMENYIVECINSLCRRYLEMDTNLTFTLNYDTSAQNEEVQAKAYQTSLSSGVLTLNDIRGEMGQPLYDMPEADEPFIMTSQGPVFLKGQLAVSTSGETIGQPSEANPLSPQEAQPQVGQESAPQANGQKDDGQSQEDKTGLVAPQNQTAPEMTNVLGQKSANLIDGELESFSKFVKARIKKGGAYRDFQFRYITEDDAYALNQDAQAVLKGDTYTPPKGVQAAAQRALDWIKEDKAGDGFTSVGRKRASDLARGAGVSMTTVRRMKAFFDRHQGDKDATGFKAGEDGYPSAGRVAWDAWGGDAGYSWVKGIAGEEKSEISDTPKGRSLTKRKAEDLPGYEARVKNEKKHHAAILAALGLGVKGIKGAIKQAQEAVHVAGNTDAIISATNLAVAQNITLDPQPITEALTNLITDAGKLGNIGGSAQVQRIPLTKIDAGLQARLNNVDAVARGIGDTSLTRIRTAIIDGLANGSSASDIADQINSVIANPYRADMIAITETNTAYNAAALDTYTEAGVDGWDWLAYEDACEICLEGEAANPHPLDDMDIPSDSSHSNCRCTITPVLPDISALPGE
jgi:SPP1 gp7 family putative phage head morphogenesis protein